MSQNKSKVFSVSIHNHTAFYEREFYLPTPWRENCSAKLRGSVEFLEVPKSKSGGSKPERGKEVSLQVGLGWLLEQGGGHYGDTGCRVDKGLQESFCLLVHSKLFGFLEFQLLSYLSCILFSLYDCINGRVYVLYLNRDSNHENIIAWKSTEILGRGIKFILPRSWKDGKH